MRINGEKKASVVSAIAPCAVAGLRRVATDLLSPNLNAPAAIEMPLFAAQTALIAG